MAVWWNKKEKRNQWTLNTNGMANIENKINSPTGAINFLSVWLGLITRLNARYESYTIANGLHPTCHMINIYILHYARKLYFNKVKICELFENSTQSDVSEKWVFLLEYFIQYSANVIWIFLLDGEMFCGNFIRIIKIPAIGFSFE